MIKIKKPEEVEEMRPACQLAAAVLDQVASRCAPGVSTQALDDYAAELIEAAGAKSAFLGYRGYPAQICTSVNDEVVHGIPNRRPLEMGDVVSIDVGVELGGWIGDNARTVAVGVQDPEVLQLLEVTRRSLEAAIEKAVHGGRLSDISHAVESVVLGAGMFVVKDFVGHGVGRSMHEEPQIPNFGPPGKGPPLKTGMTLAIEPMVNLGTAKVEVMEDGWTVRTMDRRPSAHFEHTVLVQEGQAEILTCKKAS
jgi:methionyl aminopeptidase